MDPAPESLAWIDALGLCLVALGAALGLWSGFWKQLMRTAGLVAAVLVPRAFAPHLAPLLTSALPDIPIRIANGMVWTALFLATLLAAGLLVRLGNRSLQALNLRLIDRLLGSLVGAATGLVLHSVVLLLLCQFTPAAWARDTLDETASLALLDTLARRAELLLDAESLELLCPWLDPIPESGHGPRSH